MAKIRITANNETIEFEVGSDLDGMQIQVDVDDVAAFGIDVDPAGQRDVDGVAKFIIGRWPDSQTWERVGTVPFPDDGERRCEICGDSFNLAEGGIDYVADLDGSVCPSDEDDWKEKL